MKVQTIYQKFSRWWPLALECYNLKQWVLIFRINRKTLDLKATLLSMYIYKSFSYAITFCRIRKLCVSPFCKVTFVPKMPNYKMETIYAYKMARSLTIIDYNHPIASKEAHNILPHPKCRDISYKWWNVVFLKVHQALYKISKEYQTVLGRHSLHSAYWPQRQVCSIPVYWQFLQIFSSRGRYQIWQNLEAKGNPVTFLTFFENFIIIGPRSDHSLP